MDAMCQKYSVLPSAIVAEDTYLWRMNAILALGSAEPEPSAPGTEFDPGLADAMVTL